MPPNKAAITPRALMSAPTETQRTRSTRVVGIAAWTDNAAEAHPSTAAIPGLWARFTHEDWFARLEHNGGVGPPAPLYSYYQAAASWRHRHLVGRAGHRASG